MSENGKKGRSKTGIDPSTPPLGVQRSTITPKLLVRAKLISFTSGVPLVSPSRDIQLLEASTGRRAIRQEVASVARQAEAAKARYDECARELR